EHTVPHDRPRARPSRAAAAQERRGHAAAPRRPGVLRPGHHLGRAHPAGAGRRRPVPHHRVAARRRRAARRAAGQRGLPELPGPARLRHAARGRARAAHRDAAVDRDRAVHLALRAPARGPHARLPRRPARRGAERRLRAVGRDGAGALPAAGVRVARRARRLHPAVRRPGLLDRPHDAHRRHRPRRDDPADHDGDQPRGLPPGAPAARGGGARARRHALGDDQDGCPALRQVRSGQRRHARPRPGAGRDARRPARALRLGRRDAQPDLARQPVDHRGQHRRAVPGVDRARHQCPHRDRPRAVRHHLRGQLRRPRRARPARRLRRGCRM
ncbi:MAG: Phosphate transport system permease protein PstC, partial [uncultured Solirubrobacteraceae bacterium]